MCNEKRAQTWAGKKSGGCDLEITAPAFMAGDDCANKPSGLSHFSAVYDPEASTQPGHSCEPASGETGPIAAQFLSAGPRDGLRVVQVLP